MSIAPEISVIIPVYNAQSYLAEAIQSVLHQTYEDWELIAVDDGSSESGALVVGESPVGGPVVVDDSTPLSGPGVDVVVA